MAAAAVQGAAGHRAAWRAPSDAPSRDPTDPERNAGALLAEAEAAAAAAKRASAEGVARAHARIACAPRRSSCGAGGHAGGYTGGHAGGGGVVGYEDDRDDE
eukprot:4613028-Prymnesium_polylepis.1